MFVKKIIFLSFTFLLLQVGTSLAQKAQTQPQPKKIAKKDLSKTPWSGINLLSIEDDIKLGKQTKQEISSKPKEYPLLPEKGNEQIYSYVRNITKTIIEKGNVEYKDKFAWEVHIIKDDKTLNAFCTPGGYIYVYTGLIKFLDSEDQLAGVLGHEIAHAARRHSTRQLTKMMGVQVLELLGNATGKNTTVVENVASTIVGLKFSRTHETEADEFSVRYLCRSGYNSAGAAGFFKKIEGKGGTPPAFMSTHPNPKNRVQEIQNNAVAYSCTGTTTNTTQYAKMKDLLQ
jgi:beta-barrel assembly-enhancing protease